MLLKHSTFHQLIIALVQVQLPRAMLQLVDSPLNPAEVPLCLRLDYTKAFEHICDLYLLQKLVESALKHAVFGGIFARAATTASREEALDIQDERAKEAPMDVLVLAYTHIIVLLLSFFAILRPHDRTL